MDGRREGDEVVERPRADAAERRVLRRVWLLPLPLLAAPSLVMLAAMLKLIPLETLLVTVAIAPAWPAFFLGPLGVLIAPVLAGLPWYGVGVCVAHVVLMGRRTRGAWAVRVVLGLGLGFTVLGAWLMSGWNPD